jgi:uncharacterized protein (DUF2132 family)
MDAGKGLKMLLNNGLIMFEGLDKLTQRINFACFQQC